MSDELTEAIAAERAVYLRKIDLARAENKRLRRIEKAARAVLADRIIHDNQHGECECPSCSKLRAALEEK